MAKSNNKEKEVKLVVPFGPQHPASSHFRATVQLAGEKIVDLAPHPGYLHRGFEKLMEYRTHEQNAVLVDRLCVLEPYSWELGYANVSEKIAGVEAPKRAKFVRTIMTELQRILNHITWMGIMGLALGFETTNKIAWGDREKILRLFETVSGGRIYPCHFTPGGVRRDFPEGFEKEILKTIDYIEERLDFYDDLFFKNPTVINRTEDLGVLDSQEAVDLGVVGPSLRASGVMSDVRKDESYEAYPEADFMIVAREEGDSYARILCRRGEIAESIRIIRQLLEKMPPKGRIKSKMPPKIPKEDAYFCFESARGEACFHMVGNETDKPYRVKVKGPSFLHTLAAFPHLVKGAEMADVPAIYWSLDPCPADMDR